ncbi:hypothetical protein FRC12_009134 [Ceratobasidium sp. 428]|nr:hypothetical protein FRC12_009134 [Ceratobasidium sp. 428]
MITSFAPLAVFAAIAVASYDPAPCQWYVLRTLVRPCNNELAIQELLPSVTGGGGNGAECKIGEKFLCCPQANTWQNCEWFGTAPLCDGECPEGKYEVTTDGSGDGNTCASDLRKAFCCDKRDDLETDNENTKWNTGMRIAAKLVQDALGN